MTISLAPFCEDTCQEVPLVICWLTCRAQEILHILLAWCRCTHVHGILKQLKFRKVCAEVSLDGTGYI